MRPAYVSDILSQGRCVCFVCTLFYLLYLLGPEISIPASFSPALGDAVPHSLVQLFLILHFQRPHKELPVGYRLHRRHIGLHIASDTEAYLLCISLCRSFIDHNFARLTEIEMTLFRSGSK